jgi:hypothetical protein
MPSNPYAFPGKHWERDLGSDVTHAGMTLRDYFAGQALVGIMSDPGMRPASLSEFGHMATRMYQVADAMLVAREKEAPDAVS